MVIADEHEFSHDVKTLLEMVLVLQTVHPSIEVRIKLNLKQADDERNNKDKLHVIQPSKLYRGT